VSPKPGDGAGHDGSKLDAFVDLLREHGREPMRNGSQVTARCPSHLPDARPALSVSEGDDGRVLVHCHRGCSVDEICRALGIRSRDLFAANGHGPLSTPSAVETSAALKEPPEPLPSEADLQRAQERLHGSDVEKRLQTERGWSLMTILGYELGLGEDGRIIIPFRDQAGQLVSSERYAPFERGSVKMLPLKGRPRPLLFPPGALKEEILIAEGASDAIAAVSRGLTAVGAPSASTWRDRWTEQLKAAGVTTAYVIGDCDGAGRKFAPRVAESLASYGIEPFTIDLDPARDDGFDLTDFLLAHDGPSSDIEKTLKQLAKPYVDTVQDDEELQWPALLIRDMPEFPVDALPRSVAEWVTATAEHTQTPVDLPAFAALGVLSSAALGGAIVDCGQWEEELGLYLLLALASGDRKSTVLRAATQPLRTLERERRATAARGLHELATRRTALEVRIKKLTSRMGAANDGERTQAEDEYAQSTAELAQLPEPVAPRIFADDATPEAMGTLLARHRAIAVLVAESAFIDNLIGRYNDGKANLHLVCAAYSGEQATIDRKGNESEYLERPLLSIALTVQPHVLEKLISHDVARSQGLVARFAYALPKTLLGRRRIGAPAVSPDVAQGWIATVRRVAAVTSADNADNAEPATPNIDIAASRGMKMAFEGSVWLGPNVWFIRDRGLLWENADG
jgi:putative DNA primase/helicase